MLVFLAILSGALISITVAQNGNLALYLGNIRATTLVHVVGLVTVLLLLLLTRTRFQWSRKTPWYGYLGGALGVLSVLGSNASFAALGISVSLAVMLLGQAFMGMAVDQFGLFGAEKRPFQPAHLISIALIIGGILVMLV